MGGTGRGQGDKGLSYHMRHSHRVYWGDRGQGLGGTAVRGQGLRGTRGYHNTPLGSGVRGDRG